MRTRASQDGCRVGRREEARSLGRRARAADWPGGALAGRPVSTVLSFVVVVVVVIVAVFFLMFEMRILA